MELKIALTLLTKSGAIMCAYNHDALVGDTGLAVPVDPNALALETLDGEAHDIAAWLATGDAETARCTITPGWRGMRASHALACAVQDRSTPQQAAAPIAPGLLASIKRVAHAMSADETRYMLRGVCLETHGDGWRVIATDTRRLMAVASPDVGDDARAHELMIPADVVKTIGRISREILALSPSRLDLGDGITLHYRATEGCFPEWRQAIPERLDIGLAGDMAQAAKAVALARAVKAENPAFVPDGGFLVETAGAGRAWRVDGTPCECPDGELVGFCPQYAADAAKAMPGAAWYADSLDSPWCARAPGSLYLVMPMRVQ